MNAIVATSIKTGQMFHFDLDTNEWMLSDSHELTCRDAKESDLQYAKDAAIETLLGEIEIIEL